MAINFPNSPSLDEEYTSGSTTWVWDGTKWVLKTVTANITTAPVGTMLDWPTTTSYPTGYLRADGSAVSRSTYATLFALIGTTYGSGDGSSTFNLPNIISAGTGSPVTLIKSVSSGIVEPSLVAHASSHAFGGADVIAVDPRQIIGLTIDQKTASYTLALSDHNKLIEMSSASALTLTIPNDSTVNFPIGSEITVLQVNNGQVTFAGAVGVTVNARIGLKLSGIWAAATLVKRQANVWVIIGDTTA